MAFENMDMDDMDLEEEETAPPEESGNRNFLIVAGILGGITILALVCIVLYAMIFLPQQQHARETQSAQVNAQNTEMAHSIELTAIAQAFTATPTVTATPLPNTPTSTATPVIAVPTNTSVPTEDPRTATVAALLTQAASAAQTEMPTSTALPQTGFVDQVGVPGLLGLAVLLIAVIFLARRLRTV